VLGAGITDIVYLLNKEFMALVGIHCSLPPPSLRWLHRWLQNFAYRRPSRGGSLLLRVIALVITSSPSPPRDPRCPHQPTDNLRSE